MQVARICASLVARGVLPLGVLSMQAEKCCLSHVCITGISSSGARRCNLHVGFLVKGRQLPLLQDCLVRLLTYAKQLAFKLTACLAWGQHAAEHPAARGL